MLSRYITQWLFSLGLDTVLTNKMAERITDDTYPDVHSKWNGKQIISEAYVYQSLTKQSVVDGIDYGCLWRCESRIAKGVKYAGMAAKGKGNSVYSLARTKHSCYSNSWKLQHVASS